MFFVVLSGEVMTSSYKSDGGERSYEQLLVLPPVNECSGATSNRSFAKWATCQGLHRSTRLAPPITVVKLYEKVCEDKRFPTPDRTRKTKKVERKSRNAY